MTTDRRRFLRFAGAASTAAVAGITATATTDAGAATASLNRSAFAGLLGEEFAFEQQVVDSVVARLAAVEALPEANTPEEGERRFRAIFKVQSGRLEQATYRVKHRRLGEFAMFVSPKNDRRDVVEAIFNRL